MSKKDINSPHNNIVVWKALSIKDKSEDVLRAFAASFFASQILSIFRPRVAFHSITLFLSLTLAQTHTHTHSFSLFIYLSMYTSISFVLSTLSISYKKMQSQPACINKLIDPVFLNFYIFLSNIYRAFFQIHCNSFPCM